MGYIVVDLLLKLLDDVLLILRPGGQLFGDEIAFEVGHGSFNLLGLPASTFG